MTEAEYREYRKGRSVERLLEALLIAKDIAGKEFKDEGRAIEFIIEALLHKLPSQKAEAALIVSNRDLIWDAFEALSEVDVKIYGASRLLKRLNTLSRLASP